jgi:hypothetical protein
VARAGIVVEIASRRGGELNESARTARIIGR